MKYGVIPTNPLERLALLAGRVPVPLLDGLFALLKARGLMAAARLGVFEALSGGPRTAADLAGELRLHPDALALLLRAAAFCDYLEIDGERYGLSRLGRAMLLRGAPRSLAGFLEWNYTQWEVIEHLEELLRTGRGVDFHRTMTDPGEWAIYQRAMLEIARFDAPALAARVPVRRGARRLLDVAGSHGLLGAAICRRHPPMRSTVLDLPAALPSARQLAVEAGIADLVEHRPGDLLHDDFGNGLDVVLLANILHHFGPQQNRAVLAKAAAALVPDGTLVIWDFAIPKPGAKPGFGDGVALFFRLTSTARCYAADEYGDWLRAAGLHRVKVARPPLSPGNVLLTARR